MVSFRTAVGAIALLVSGLPALAGPCSGEIAPVQSELDARTLAIIMPRGSRAKRAPRWGWRCRREAHLLLLDAGTPMPRGWARRLPPWRRRGTRTAPAIRACASRPLRRRGARSADDIVPRRPRKRVAGAHHLLRARAPWRGRELLPAETRTGGGGVLAHAELRRHQALLARASASRWR